MKLLNNNNNKTNYQYQLNLIFKKKWEKKIEIKVELQWMKNLIEKIILFSYFSYIF